MTTSVTNMAGCSIPVAGGLHHGVDQDWYGLPWRRLAGCGPSTASNILRYLGGRVALPLPTHSREEMRQVMDWVWGYVTSGLRGLNTTGRFVNGLDAIFAELGSPLRCQALDVPQEPEGRPKLSEVAAFLRAGLAQDCPVAFLNLHNGGIPQLETWHWVTVVGISGSGETAALDIYDNGHRLAVNLPRWLRDTRRGGGFVYVVDSREGAA